MGPCGAIHIAIGLLLNVTASSVRGFMSNWEAKLGVDTGLTDKVMWGDDYHAFRGTWPDTGGYPATFNDIDLKVHPKVPRRQRGDRCVWTSIDAEALTAEVAAKIDPTS